MAIVVVTDYTIEIFNSWHEVKKNTSLKKEDFAKMGSDYITKLDLESYEITKDIKLLERVASDKVFAKQKMSGIDLIGLGTFILVLYSMIS